MKNIFRNRLVLARYLGIILIVITLLVPVYAATTSKLCIIYVQEDEFYNYDFLSKTLPVSGSNVDWPMAMLFYNNANVQKVKSMYFGNTPGTIMYARLDDGQGWLWASDTGTKCLTWWSTYLNQYVYLHMRVYAPLVTGYMNNAGYGKYVLGTTHYDNYPTESWSGYSEYAEHDFASYAQLHGYTVFVDWSDWHNYEPLRYERTHIWLNDGYTTAVYVP